MNRELTLLLAATVFSFLSLLVGVFFLVSYTKVQKEMRQEVVAQPTKAVMMVPSPTVVITATPTAALQLRKTVR